MKTTTPSCSDGSVSVRAEVQSVIDARGALMQNVWKHAMMDFLTSPTKMFEQSLFPTGWQEMRWWSFLNQGNCHAVMERFMLDICAQFAWNARCGVFWLQPSLNATVVDDG